MKASYLRVSFFLPFAFFLLYCSQTPHYKYEAKAGVLDLRGDTAKSIPELSFANKEILKLNGEWEFYWNALLDPIDFESNNLPPSKQIVKVPSRWTKYRLGDTSSPELGFGTYRLKILFPQNSFLKQQILALRVKYQLTSVRIFYNGVSVAAEGVVSTEANTFRAEYRPITVNLPAEGKNKNEAEVIVQIANFAHQAGGFITPLEIGLMPAMVIDTRSKQLTDAFLLGGTLVMACYFFALFLSRPSDKASLWFAVSCFAILMRAAVTGERLVYFVFPNLSWINLLRVTYLTAVAAMVAVLYYLEALLPMDTHRKIRIALVSILLLIALPMPFVSALTITALVPSIEIMIPIAILYACTVAFTALIRRRENTLAVFGGFFFAGIAVINDIVYNNYLIGPGYVLPYGFLLLILMHATALSIRLAKSFKKTELQKSDLEIEVELRTKKLREAVALAEDATREKSAFFAMMTHELRTPLNGIIGIANVMQKSTLSIEQEKNLKIIHSSGAHLMSVINDILDFSVIDAGKLVLHSAPFSPQEFLDDITQVAHALVKDKRLELVVHPLPANFPQKVNADEARLKQALLNLLGNAIKFTQRGKVVLTCKLVEIKHNAALVEFSVEDTGIGINENDLGKLFKPYMQADQRTARRFGGTGLGLAITASIVEAFGGKISVESNIGVGSRFAFQIPLPVEQKKWYTISPKTPAAQSTDKIAGEYPMRILVVEDELVNQIVITESLRLLGYDARVVSSGFEAVASATQEKFDLVLMDIQMPQLSGIETASRILALPGCENYRIIAVTADASNENRQNCSSSGMVDFLMKPYTLAALREMLLRWAPKNVKD